jgi:NIPSNAP
MKRALVSALLATIIVGLSMARADDKPKDERLFELRTYTCNDGKLDELHKRFREHTNRLFVKHGMELVGYWTPAEGPEAENTLVYLLAFPNREARDKAFKDFGADAEWQAAYKASHANGPLVKQVKSQFLNPTDYSPIK